MVRCAAFVWGLVVVSGLLALTAYSAKPGESGDPTPHWPSASRIVAATDRPTLVLFLDPDCPCSSATLAELERCLARLRAPIAVVAVFVGRESADGAPSRWRRKVGAMAGVQLFDDDCGEERERFGAATSGLVLLYRADGRLAFRGGITTARGHEGDSLGGAAVVTVASGETPSCSSTPVYGCPLERTRCEVHP